MEYIHLKPVGSTADCNPTTQQRKIYKFHEARYSDEADDIYSMEWFQRTKDYLKQYAQPDTNPRALEDWGMIENLEFGEFYLAHPIAGHGLWHFLDACHQLDRVVCGVSARDLSVVESWRAMTPFRYLKAKKIRIKWDKSLNVLKKEIQCGILEGEALVTKLYSILCGVERLENSFAALEESFAANLRGLQFMEEMVGKARKVVVERRGMIAGGLNIEDGGQSQEIETESEISGDSFYEKPSATSDSDAAHNPNINAPETDAASVHTLEEPKPQRDAADYSSTTTSLVMLLGVFMVASTASLWTQYGW
ncbi:hypothetical protein ACEPPN_014207 [Leptodophora sp. 'Broadleaf-Isolate-01']